jgi:hypothetical protein
MKCDKCGRETDDITFNLYGEHRCEFCHDDYLMTDRGKPEYLFGLVTGQLELKDYDSDFLGHVAACWKKYRPLLNLTETELRVIEAVADAMGLL